MPQSEQWGPRPPRSRASPPQQEGFREADKYQMGEGWAARNTLPTCQELLAPVGAWAGVGGPMLPETARLAPRAPAGSQGRGQLEKDPQPPAPLRPHGCRGCPGQGTHPLCWRHTGKVPYPVSPPWEATGPAVAWTHRPHRAALPGTVPGSSVTQPLGSAKAWPCQTAQHRGCAAAPMPPAEPTVRHPGSQCPG